MIKGVGRSRFSSPPPQAATQNINDRMIGLRILHRGKWEENASVCVLTELVSIDQYFSTKVVLTAEIRFVDLVCIVNGGSL